MKHTVKILIAAGLLLADVTGAVGQEPADTMAFKYDRSESPEKTYAYLKRQASRVCGIDYSHKAERVCINGYLQEVVAKAGQPQLIALHEKRTKKPKRTTKFAVAKLGTPPSPSP